MPRPSHAASCALLTALVASSTVASAQTASPAAAPPSPPAASPADATTAPAPATGSAPSDAAASGATPVPDAATPAPSASAPEAAAATPHPVAAPVTPAVLNNLLANLLGGFSFGSYGRVIAGTDLRGHVARPANLVAHGTRIDESTYAELELHHDDNFGPVHTRVVATLGIMGPLFHDNGTFDIHMAVRNLYVEERGAFTPGLSFWVGSRMYRGDDVYLLDFWPLDNLNTVGGGARYDAGDYFTFALHGGTNRLDNSYQYQQISVVPRDGLGAASVALLDRPRFIGSLKATWWPLGRHARTGLKLSLYGEAHGLPEGVRQNTDSGQLELMPADSGFVVGGQVGAYTGLRNTYVNLFFRYGQGLGAYGDMAVPYTVSAMQTSARARDVTLALAGNWEHGMVGVLVGAYLRYFRDADAAVYGRNDMFEGTLVVRPSVWIGRHLGIAVEGSYQAVSYNALDPVSGDGPRAGSLWRFAVMPYVTPAGRGNFTRPHLRLIYAVTLRDEGAQHMYPPDDPFSRNSVEHFLGVGCEWWFNSSYM